jgi:glucosamine-6-phosphate deaminase
VAVVPDRRKAQAAKSCLEGPITPMAPASALRNHPNSAVFLNKDSAALLTKK